MITIKGYDDRRFSVKVTSRNNWHSLLRCIKDISVHEFDREENVWLIPYTCHQELFSARQVKYESIYTDMEFEKK